MSPTELEDWFETERASRPAIPAARANRRPLRGRRIVERKTADELTEDDHDWMSKMIGYCRLAPRPSGDIENSKWRYSLLN